MLEDKIIVQDRGFDAGLAALMQNANKGNMDPAALMAMMNNNGMGGNGCWWIWIILLFFVWGGWGGNGFGNRCCEASQLASQLNTDANTNLLMQAINGNKEAISTLSNTLNCDINSVQSALNTINTSVSQIACDTKLSGAQVINAIQSGNASLASHGICPRIWRQLPCEGMFLLNIVNTPATTVTAASLVSIDTTRTANQVSPTTTTSTGARALINGSGDQMVTEEISTGNRYLIYYNKSNGTFQTVNHIIPPTTAAA